LEFPLLLLPIELWEWLLGNNNTVTNNTETINESLVVEENVVLRSMNPADGPALTTLSQVPDTGGIQIAPYYHVDAYTAFMALKANTTGVVAKVVNTDEIIGAGLVSFGRFQCEDSLRDYAALRSLVVHPAYRRRGIATRLTEWRASHARQQVGEEGVLIASIQQKNDGSLAVAKTWSKQFLGRIESTVLRLGTSPSKPVDGLMARSATTADLEELTTYLNSFYQGYNFYEPQTPDSLATWLAETPFTTPFRYHCVVTDTAGNLLAGMAINEQYRLAEMRVLHLPAAMRLINKLVKLGKSFRTVPNDRVPRILTNCCSLIGRFW
jgi:GNAT superfamily N-acetyltransferase